MATNTSDVVVMPNDEAMTQPKMNRKTIHFSWMIWLSRMAKPRAGSILPPTASQLSTTGGRAAKRPSAKGAPR